MAAFASAALIPITAPTFGSPQESGIVNPAKTKVGDVCSYKETGKVSHWSGTYRYVLMISAVADNTIHVDSINAATGITRWRNTLTPEFNAIRWDDTSYSPDGGIYSFPLLVGKTWHARASFTTRGLRYRGHYDLVAKVVGWRNITVPAGTFDALKITYRGQYYSESPSDPEEDHGVGTTSMIIWRVPSLWCYVKFFSERTDWRNNIYSKYTDVLTQYPKMVK